MNVWVVSRVDKRLKTWDLRKLGNFKKIAEKLGIDGKSLAVCREPNFESFPESCEQPAVKHSKQTPTSLNFENFSAIFCL